MSIQGSVERAWQTSAGICSHLRASEGEGCWWEMLSGLSRLRVLTCSSLWAPPLAQPNRSTLLSLGVVGVQLSGNFLYKLHALSLTFWLSKLFWTCRVFTIHYFQLISILLQQLYSSTRLLVTVQESGERKLHRFIYFKITFCRVC